MTPEETRKLQAITRELQDDPRYKPEHYKLFQDAIQDGATPEQLENLRVSAGLGQPE